MVWLRFQLVHLVKVSNRRVFGQTSRCCVFSSASPSRCVVFSRLLARQTFLPFSYQRRMTYYCLSSSVRNLSGAFQRRSVRCTRRGPRGRGVVGPPVFVSGALLSSIGIGIRTVFDATVSNFVCICELLSKH